MERKLIMYITTNREQITETLREMFQKIQKHYNLISNSKEYEISIVESNTFDEDKTISRTLNGEVSFTIKRRLKLKSIKKNFLSKIRDVVIAKFTENDQEYNYKRMIICKNVYKKNLNLFEELGISGFLEVYLFAFTMCEESKYYKFDIDKDILELRSILDWDIDDFDWLECYRKFIRIAQLYQILDRPSVVKDPFSINSEPGYALLTLIGLGFSDVTYNDKYIEVRRTEENNVQFVVEGINQEIVFDLVFGETQNEKMVKNMLLILADHTKINGTKVSEITNVRNEVFGGGERYLTVITDKQNKLVQILLKNNEGTIMRTLDFSNFKARSTVNDLFLDAFPKTTIYVDVDDELVVAANISEFNA